MDTVTLLLQHPGHSMAGALVMGAAWVMAVASVADSVAEGVSDEALVHGLAGAEVSAGGDITLTGEDPMDPVMGPHTLVLIPQAPGMSSVYFEMRPTRSKTTSMPLTGGLRSWKEALQNSRGCT